MIANPAMQADRNRGMYAYRGLNARRRCLVTVTVSNQMRFRRTNAHNNTTVVFDKFVINARYATGCSGYTGWVFREKRMYAQPHRERLLLLFRPGKYRM